MLSLFLTLFLASSLAVTALIVLVWAISLKIKDASIIDLVWGAGFGLIALLCLYLVSRDFDLTAYLVLLAALPTIWAARYSAYIWWRNIGHGEDKRYTAMRELTSEGNWPWFLLFRVYAFQILAMIVVALPITVGLASAAVYGTSISALAVIGTFVWASGVAFEGIGDLQLARFIKRKKELGADVTGKVMDQGLWRYTRHPNYFGNAVLWWGIFIVAATTPWGWLSIIGPVFMNYALLKVSGAAHLERTLSQRPEYAAYMERTSQFIPRPPKADPIPQEG